MKEEDWQEDMLMTIKKIDIALDRQIGRRMADWELSTSQTYLVLYILKNHEEGTYITDLHRELGISKSTISQILKKVREKGYLAFQDGQEDDRMKRIVVTEKLLAEKYRLIDRVERIEEEIYSRLSFQERKRASQTSEKSLGTTPRDEKG